MPLPEQHGTQEAGLEDEGREYPRSQQWTGNVAYLAHELGPKTAKLYQYGQAGCKAKYEAQTKNPNPETEDRRPRGMVRPQLSPLEIQQNPRQAQLYDQKQKHK